MWPWRPRWWTWPGGAGSGSSQTWPRFPAGLGRSLAPSDRGSVASPSCFHPPSVQSVSELHTPATNEGYRTHEYSVFTNQYRLILMTYSMCLISPYSSQVDRMWAGSYTEHRAMMGGSCKDVGHTLIITKLERPVHVVDYDDLGPNPQRHFLLQSKILKHDLRAYSLENRNQNFVLFMKIT